MSETVRLPVDLARQVGSAADGHRLDVVMTRLRNEPATHRDEERTLNRRFVIPDARSFLLSGTARVAPDAPDPVLDAALGTTAPGTQFSASSHLTGDVDSRASRAFDHDRSTAWTPRLDNPYGSWIQASLAAPTTFDHLQLTFVDDTKHFVPGQVTLLADGVPVRTLPIPDVRSATGVVANPSPVDQLPRVADGTLRTVELGFDPVTARDLRIQVDTIRSSNAGREPLVVLPVSIAEADVSGVPVPASPATIDTGCRSDLVSIDGRPVSVAIQGASRDACRGLDIRACETVPPLDAGSASGRRGGTDE